jgi:enoyl-CoA hydratase/carnithine racemase
MGIDYEKKGKIAVFTINRPEVMNAIDTSSYRQLSEAMIDFRDDPNLWVEHRVGGGCPLWTSSCLDFSFV